MNQNILIICGEKDLLYNLEQIFKGQGYVVTTASDGEQGLKKYTESIPSLILLGRNLPILDGLEVVRTIRTFDVKTPILFLTSRTSYEDVIEGLEAGANDYIRKPFITQELVVRVNNFIRFSSTPENYKVDTLRRVMSHNGKMQQLGKMECQLLDILLQNKNKVVKTDDIISQIWANEKDFFSCSNLHVHIHNLKTHLSDETNLKITNVRSIGYMLTEN